MEHSTLDIRPVQPADNAALAFIIRTTLKEFGANHPGTVYYDETTDRLSEVFKAPGSFYHVAELGDVIVGGAGIYPTTGLPPGTCELVKMYLLPVARGSGLGKLLLETNIEKARQLGYSHMYLETMPELTSAIPLYEKYGFEYLDGALGESGHFGCAIHMLKAL